MNPRPAPLPETLLCVHASATQGRAWNAFAAPLRERHEVLTPDRLGYEPGAEWRIGTPTSFDAEADRLEPLLDAAPQGVHLIGHSFGGAVALQLAMRWPRRIKSLLLYEPCRFAVLLHGGASPVAAAEILAVGRAVGDEVRAGQLREAAARFVDYWSGTGSWAAMDARRQLAIVAQMPKVRAEFEAAFSDTVPLAAYAALTMPVRLVSGSCSPLPPRRICELLAGVLPSVQVACLPGIGHMGPLTHPERVRAAMSLVPRPALLAA